MRSAAAPLLLVRTLGELQVLRDGVPVDDLNSRPLLQALTCYLAVERSVSRDRLLSLFWEGRDPDKARHSLSQALYMLRKRLGDHWLETDTRGVRVNEYLWSDLVDFDRELERGDPAAALARVGGPFLQGFTSDSPTFEHWASGRRALVDRALRHAYRRVTETSIAEGDLSAALTTVRNWIQRDPADDEANHKLIEILALSGDRSGALRQYELYRRALAEDDLTPLDQTEDLVGEIRKGSLDVSGGGEPSTDSGVGSMTSNDRKSAMHEVAGAKAASAEPASTDVFPAPLELTTRIWSGSASAGPRLIRIVEGGEEAEAYPLHGRRTVVGRAEGDLLFPDDVRLENGHASFLVRSTGPDDSRSDRYIVRDEGSEGGVYVEIRGSWPLRSGDMFAVGQQLFRVDVEEDES